MDKPDTKDRKSQRQVTWAHMVRDVLIASMNKGQFPLAIVCSLLMVMILKMPAEDVSRFVFEIKHDLESHVLLGYILFVTSSAGWFYHSRWQRKLFTMEIDRMGAEKSKVQEQKLGKLASSRVGK